MESPYDDFKMEGEELDGRPETGEICAICGKSFCDPELVEGLRVQREIIF